MKWIDQPSTNEQSRANSHWYLRSPPMDWGVLHGLQKSGSDKLIGRLKSGKNYVKELKNGLAGLVNSKKKKNKKKDIPSWEKGEDSFKKKKIHTNTTRPIYTDLPVLVSLISLLYPFCVAQSSNSYLHSVFISFSHSLQSLSPSSTSCLLFLPPCSHLPFLWVYSSLIFSPPLPPPFILFSPSPSSIHLSLSLSLSLSHVVEC